MEVSEIKNALIDFIPLVKKNNKSVYDLMMIFLQNVLGYDINEDIIINKITPLTERPKQADFDKNIKFAMTALPYNADIDAKREKEAIEIALAAKTNVVMVSNGEIIRFYSIDVWDGNWESDILIEIKLFEDDPAEIAQNLWPLSKKDCHRKIRVNSNI